jgi:carbon-monoxide dehydrogenase medium subunit
VIGDPSVRHRGTLGGSVANNDPAADYPSAVLALGATVRTSRREIAAEGFFTGVFSTCLDEGEIITAVSFPIPARAGYAKFPNPASRYAMAGVFVADYSGAVRVAVTGAGPCVFRHDALEAALAADFSPSAARAVIISADGLNSDLHGSAEYRAQLVSVMAARATEVALG